MNNFISIKDHLSTKNLKDIKDYLPIKNFANKDNNLSFKNLIATHTHTKKYLFNVIYLSKTL